MMRFRRPALQLVLATLALPVAAQRPASVIGSVDVYGLQRVSEESVRGAAALAAGTALPDSASRAAIRRRLRSISGVDDAGLYTVCCDSTGRTMVFIGIAERGARRPSFRVAPSGADHLPREIVERDSVFQVRLREAVEAGRSAEVDSGGHEFFADPALNAIQHEYLAFVRDRVPLLRRVLMNSARPRERTLAAELLDYAEDVRTVIPDLLNAMRDPVSDVRNAAMRALFVIAAHGQKEPALKIQVPGAPFIDMLWSLDWTDRNKASAALWQLSAGRDPKLMGELRGQALGPLIDIARWTDPSHALPGLVILGRIEGRSDNEIFASFLRGERTAILDQAERMRKGDVHERPLEPSSLLRELVRYPTEAQRCSPPSGIVDVFFH